MIDDAKANESLILFDWSQDKMVEITLAKPDDFLKVKETLTRIGISSKKEKKLYQTCNILHKRGKYYIVHFKEIFLLDGKDSSFSLEDVSRRNRIISLLNDWKLLTVIKKDMIENQAPMSVIKIVAFKDKANWELISKYQLGKKPEKKKEISTKYIGLPETNPEDMDY